MVIEYRGWKEIEIEHIDSHKHRAVVRAQHIRDGNVRNPFAPAVCGVGYLGSGPHRAKVCGKTSRAYQCWRGMLYRCYDPVLKTKRPTYIGCSVVREWENFQNFFQWWVKEPNSSNAGFDLDKDLRVKGNNIYGPDTCSFVLCS